MSGTRRSYGQFEQDFYINQTRLESPKNSAVFYTNGSRSAAEAHVAARRAAGQPATTLEQTEYGREFDANIRPYWKRAADRRNIAEPSADVVSKRYAERASGRVEAFCNGEEPRQEGTFARVERDALLGNEKVTHLNGVRREDLKAVRNRGDPNAERDMNALIVEGDRLRNDPAREAKLAKMLQDRNKEAARLAKLDQARSKALESAVRREADRASSGTRASTAARDVAGTPAEAEARRAEAVPGKETVSAGRQQYNEKLGRGAGREKGKSTRGKDAPAAS